MDGFKQNPKIACFKEGGQVGYKSRKNPSESKDIKKDKAIVKKAVGQHESAKHKGEGKTELKLKTGGRCKKEGGNVRKYKTGGEVVGMKKTAEDRKDIANIKKKGSEPKKKAPKTKQAPTKSMGMAKPEMPMEGELPMFQYGGSTSDIDRKMMESERQRKIARTKNAMGAGLNPSQMAQFAGQEMAGQGAVSDAERQKAMQMMGQKPTGVMGAMKGVMQGGINAGGMGQAAPMPTTSGAGAITDEERALLRGIQAVGRACGGSI
jgi:hypothetical protein